MNGIIPSLNTPFDKDGNLDHDSLRRLIHHTVSAGCSGMLGLAVAGEHETLTVGEKTAFIEVVSMANAGRIPFIVSVTAPDAEASFELSKTAAFFDAAGVCVQLPDNSTRGEKLEFLQHLAQHAPGLLMVQDLDWVGDGLAVEDIQFLFERVEKFSWLKIETKNAGPKYSAVIDVTHGALNVCGGWAVTQLMDAMERGVHAFIPTGLERVYVAIHRAFENGDIDTAKALFERVLPVLNFSNQSIGTSIRFFKEVRKAEGLFATNTCRVPISDHEPYDEDERNQALETAFRLIEDV